MSCFSWLWFKLLVESQYKLTIDKCHEPDVKEIKVNELCKQHKFTILSILLSYVKQEGLENIIWGVTINMKFKMVDIQVYTCLYIGEMFKCLVYGICDSYMTKEINSWVNTSILSWLLSLLN